MSIQSKILYILNKEGKKNSLKTQGNVFYVNPWSSRTEFSNNFANASDLLMLWIMQRWSTFLIGIIAI